MRQSDTCISHVQHILHKEWQFYSNLHSIKLEEHIVECIPIVTSLLNTPQGNRRQYEASYMNLRQYEVGTMACKIG